ncbi:transcription factor FAMA [Iris pallida]|uniref:Transcription factor FAMA n=1 Tax=Iris pallida TaxID=29817 RepID=A0AAX6FE19_IRIPA|nr:transcription factor FAMA [Iris pallida]
MSKEVEESYLENPTASFEMVDYILGNPPHPQPQTPLDKMSFADVMRFADFAPKLVAPGEDDDCFARFEELYDGPRHEESPSAPLPFLVQQHGSGGGDGGGGGGEIAGAEVKNRRKRPRALKTREEAQSQRMTHIVVERNRRRQMNDHLRALRSLMPGSYVQRGDQASIVGGAIEFIRELEQLLQCLESQKRRRLFGTNDPPIPIPQPLPPPGGRDVDDTIRITDADPNGHGPLREETAENKSCLADVEVRLLGSDAVIKILSRRRPGQLIRTIAALEDLLQFTILHTNITTIEQTVLYSFNVKIAGETICAAEDIASSVQQILSFVDTSKI